MKLLTSISCFVLLLLTMTMDAQFFGSPGSTENYPGILNLKNGSVTGASINGGFNAIPGLTGASGGAISLSDVSGDSRMFVYGGGTTDIPLLQMTGTVLNGSSNRFMTFINDEVSFKDHWGFNLNADDINGTAFQFEYFFAGNYTTALTITQNGISGSSDRRLKTNINTINSALPSLMKLNPTNYNRKINLGQEEYGFIAQEVEKIYPDMVSVIPTEDGEGQYMMNYTQLIPILTKAIQEQQEMIEKQNDMIKDLSKRLLEVEMSK